MMVLRYRESYKSEDNVGERTVRRITGRSKKETASNLPSVTPCLYNIITRKCLKLWIEELFCPNTKFEF
jgi:hypothetical protein